MRCGVQALSHPKRLTVLGNTTVYRRREAGRLIICFWCIGSRSCRPGCDSHFVWQLGVHSPLFQTIIALLPVVAGVLLFSLLENDLFALIFLSYAAFFGLLMQIGELPYFTDTNQRYNDYLILGTIGTILLFMAFSFAESWITISGSSLVIKEVFGFYEVYVFIILFIAAFTLLDWRISKVPSLPFSPLGYAFVLFLPLFLMGFLWWILPYVLTNLLLFLVSLIIIVKGARDEQHGTFNLGLLIMMTWIACRFFEFDMSSIVRGILFLLLGFGFFLANYLMTSGGKTSS
jgi:hypothetical protein